MFCSGVRWFTGAACSTSAEMVKPLFPQGGIEYAA